MNGLFEWLKSIAQYLKVWVVVQPWERCLRTRFGKHAVVLDEGWHLKIPFVDEVRIVNSRLRVYPFPQLTVETRDGKTIVIAGVIGFTITDPLAAAMRLQQPENSCATVVGAAMTPYIRERDAADVRLSDLEAAAVKELARFAPGLTFEFVRILDFAAVRTFRLLQENWRPSTSMDAHDRT